MIEARFAEIRARFRRRSIRPCSPKSKRPLRRPPCATRRPTRFDAFYRADPVFRVLGRHEPGGASRTRATRIVTICLKAHGETPGDATGDQMRLMADLAERYGHGELRISHEQNVILPHVHKSDLPALHAALRARALATANVGLISDIIACPGMDYCALATARSIPVAQADRHPL